jgi:cobalt/nickel transport system ATP-binding protein
MNSSTPIIRLNDINFSFPESAPVFKSLDLTMYTGDRIGLVAPNGSGKTTLFHVIMGLLKPDAGKIEIFGKKIVKEKDFLEVRRRIGLLFQDADDQLFSPTVIEDVAFGPLNQGLSKKKALEKSKKTLEFLGLSGFEDRITFKLSGGEKRLVSLATVLAMTPQVLLLDEPTIGLDTHTKAKLIQAMQSLSISLMAVSHEFDFIEATTNKIYTLENGKIRMDQEVYLHHHEHAHIMGRQPHRHI